MALKFSQELVGEIEQPPQEPLEPISISWDTHKENIQPLSQGRKIDALFQSLSIVNDNHSKLELFKKRKEQFDRDLELNSDDASERLSLWHDYIDWLEQNVPSGGKANGITNAIEQCIELYYDKKEFKQDKRLFDIFMKFKRFCDEPVEIYGFMYANSISTLLARFYLNWSWQYEMKKNMNKAQDILKLGIKNLASQRDVLIEAQTQLKFRISRMIRAGELDECPEFGPDGVSVREAQVDLANGDIRAALQTLKFRVNKRKGDIKVPVRRVGNAVVKQSATNLGGLKSQTKVVNGIRVAKTNGKAVSKAQVRSNKPISIFVEPNGSTENSDVRGGNNNNGRNVEQENVGLAAIMKSNVPTSQRIQFVGSRGAENQVPKAGTITKH